MKTLYLLLCIIFVSFSYLLNKDVVNLKQQNKDLENRIDSLQSEIKIREIDLGRYEAALFIFTEENLTCGKKFDEVLSKME